jgi:exodeoxyribonuclease V alpha subunit
MKLAAELLTTDGHEADVEAVCTIIEEMGQQQELMIDKGEGGMPLCYKPAFFTTESHLAQLLRQQLTHSTAVDLPRVRIWIERFTQNRGIALSPQQQQAVEIAASSRVMVLTGGPGTGKTFCTRTIVALWKAMGKKIGLAAPTGRAAQRMGEVTGLAAKTLHRMLEFDPTTRGFKRDKDNPRVAFNGIVSSLPGSQTTSKFSHILIASSPQLSCCRGSLLVSRAVDIKIASQFEIIQSAIN